MTTTLGILRVVTAPVAVYCSPSSDYAHNGNLSIKNIYKSNNEVNFTQSLTPSLDSIDSYLHPFPTTATVKNRVPAKVT